MVGGTLGQDTATTQNCEGPIQQSGRRNIIGGSGIQQDGTQVQLHQSPLATVCQWLAGLARCLTVMQVQPSSGAWLDGRCARVTEA